tara:strand:- start:1148 stop:1456 length:309 start_codon:yes stop_codon:yes gene_type:complete
MRDIEPGEPLWEIRALRIENEILVGRFERMRSAFEKKLTEKLVLHKHYRQALKSARTTNERLKKELDVCCPHNGILLEEDDGLTDGPKDRRFLTPLPKDAAL